MTQNPEAPQNPEPTEPTAATPIDLPAQEPPQQAPATSGRRGVPAWAVISGAAAVGLIVVAGVGGYALGQASDSDRGRLAGARIATEQAPGQGRDGMQRGPQDHHGRMQGPGDRGPGSMLSDDDLRTMLEQFMEEFGGQLPFDGGRSPFDGGHGGRQGGSSLGS